MWKLQRPYSQLYYSFRIQRLNQGKIYFPQNKENDIRNIVRVFIFQRLASEHYRLRDSNVAGWRSWSGHQQKTRSGSEIYSTKRQITGKWAEFFCWNIFARVKAGTHEGTCSRRTLLQHAPGAKLSRLHQRFLAKKYVAKQNFCSRVLLPHIKLVWYEGASSRGKPFARVSFRSKLPRVYRP